MAHHYQIRGGSLRIVRYSGESSLFFSFYIYDQKSKVAAYCWYSTSVDWAKMEKLEFERGDKKVYRHQVGVANPGIPFVLAKPLDLEHLKNAKCSLSIAQDADSSSKGTATLLLDQPPVVHLVFPMVADFGDGFPRKTSGAISQIEIAKTNLPKLPPEYLEPK